MAMQGIDISYAQAGLDLSNFLAPIRDSPQAQTALMALLLLTMLRALASHIDVARIVGRCRRERRIYSGLMDCFRNHVSPMDWLDGHHRGNG